MAEISQNSKNYRAEIPGRELLEVITDSQGQEQLKAVASASTLKLLRELKKQSSQISNWPAPKGNSCSELLIRELILKVKGEWKFPLEDAELCHCRAVPAVKVDQAIVSGAHGVEKIRRMTSANTACGTCLPEIEKLLSFRLIK